VWAESRPLTNPRLKSPVCERQYRALGMGRTRADARPSRCSPAASYRVPPNGTFRARCDVAQRRKPSLRQNLCSGYLRHAISDTPSGSLHGWCLVPTYDPITASSLIDSAPQVIAGLEDRTRATGLASGHASSAWHQRGCSAVQTAGARRCRLSCRRPPSLLLVPAATARLAYEGRRFDGPRV
jgi:hypothetical protein